MFVEAARLITIVYLLVLAIALLTGVGRVVLAAPARAIYSLVRMSLLLISLGKISIEPLARKTFGGGISGSAGTLREAVRDWREHRSEERQLAEGKEPVLQQITWASTLGDGQAPSWDMPKAGLDEAWPQGEAPAPEEEDDRSEDLPPDIFPLEPLDR